jgi:hypothetical protein
MPTEMLFEVSDGGTVAASFERPADALEKAQALIVGGSAWVLITDLVGRRYTPEESERMFVPKAPA